MKSFAYKLQGNKDIVRLTVVIAAVLAIMTVVMPDKLWSWASFQSMMYQFPEYGIMAFGCALCMMSGGIDLSLVGVANFASMIAAKYLLATLSEDAGTAANQGIFIVIAILISLAIGLSAGFLNGFLIAKTKIPAMLITIGTCQIFTGIVYVVSEAKAVSGMPMIFSNTLTVKVLGYIPLPAVVFAVVAVALWILMVKTPFGIKIHMFGTNPNAYTFSGQNGDNLLMTTYTISGFMAGIASIIMLANYNSAKAGYGEAYSMQCILISVLGGVSPLGGSGKIGGIVLAVITLQLISAALNMVPWIDTFYKPLIWGIVLISVLYMDVATNRREIKRLERSNA